ncbi:hypothetical protein [Pandoraea apista]|uniref:hypothetical protein n=1 Tax=Pandoraea apista TaxID=93218 RepID=UPI000659607A|nr:hypothetical protein [Pandoraea apista]ALS64567.1 hypothetical protein AT395_05840 [Pandoraea apista]RRW88465.1 hypothetical protein EGJ54_24700 [Pandoraea apista]RRW96830.1 hypothetical protein EGJ56_24680 [Pandoraea apista]CFB64502.1 hypothetical protein LMG16407_04366 [Pandoraea apista]
MDEFMYVPLVGEPHHAAKIRRGDWEYLAKVLGLRRTRWFRDPETGAIRAHKTSSRYASGTHSYDVVAALHCLKDGDSYLQADPFDLTNVQVCRH